MTNDITQKLLAAYESKQSVRTVSSNDTVPRQSYIQSAAVLHNFIPDEINPQDSTFRDERPRLLLYDYIVPAAGERAEMRFMLKLDARRAALKNFATREAMRKALAVNPNRSLTPLQKTWEEYLKTGTVPNPETLGYQSLLNLCQIASWLNGIDPNFPEQTYLLELARRRSVLVSFEHLVIENFTGRINELAEIREYLGLIPPDNEKDFIHRQFYNWNKEPRRSFLSIHGPGGIGKSALIGRILWEQTQGTPELSVPFAYLAFDQPTLRIETPFTLLVEAAAQFELQFPEDKDSIQLFRNKIRQFRDERTDLGTRKKATTSREKRIDEVRHLDKELYNDFARLLKRIARRTFKDHKVQVPVLIVLDTFEEVQYRDRERLVGLWRMLETIQKSYKRLRVIISGRVPVSELSGSRKDIIEISLAELVLEDRIALLQRLGVADFDTAQNIALQVGGNPLSLRLAANLVASDPDAFGMEGLEDTDDNWLSFKVDEELIQGQLYKRILNHIHDENVRKLAHPGMILRQVDPDVILNVLAPLCKIPVGNLEEAEQLFNELKREHSIVQPGEKGTLIYRPEIRRGIIRLLQQDRFAEVRRLHRRAVDYYQYKDGMEARAEELYHRLVLGEDDNWTLDNRWMKGIESSIAASVDDYPDNSKAWLASRIDLEVPREVFLNADIREWERNIFRKVQLALSELDTNWALQLLSERSERTQASPLFACEAKAYLLRSDVAQAQVALDQGIKSISLSNNRGRLAELFWFQSQVDLFVENFEAADRSLERAERAVEKATNPIPVTHILCHRLLIRQRYPQRDPLPLQNRNYRQSSTMLRVHLNRACERIDVNIAYSAQFVIKLAISLLAEEFPKTSEHLTQFISEGFSLSDSFSLEEYNLTSENLRGLEEYYEEWENELNLSQSPEDAA